MGVERKELGEENKIVLLGYHNSQAKVKTLFPAYTHIQCNMIIEFLVTAGIKVFYHIL